jgi:hypothetical protein
MPSLSSDTIYPDPVDFFEKLAALYAEMDQAYDETAAAYGFNCRGCADNCCQTRFYHHTHIETAYLLTGFSKLAFDQQKLIQRRAREVAAAQAENPRGADRLMCPVNMDGWCMLYPYRPMICRLHGLPHELRMPGKPKTYGPGCGEFERVCGDKPYAPFDRTPFYAQMARLEQAFKAHCGIEARIRKTVAEMLVDAAIS